MKKLIILTIILFNVQFPLASISFQIEQNPELIIQAGHTMQVYSLAISPDGKILASGSWDRTIKLWNIKTGRQIKTFENYIAPVYAIIFSPDGKTLASASDSGKMILWNVETGKKINTFEINSSQTFLTQYNSFSNSIAFTPDGKFLASGSYELIKLWDIKTGRQREIITNHKDYVSSVAFSQDGRILASGSRDNKINLWDVKTGRLIKSFKVSNKWISFLTFLSGGKTLISVSSNKVIFWDTETGQQSDFLETSSDSVASTDSSISSATLSCDGKTLALGIHKTIKLWNIVTGNQIKTLKGHENTILSLAFSPDGKTLISGSDIANKGYGMIRVWDVEIGQQIKSFESHAKRIWSVAYSPDGKTVASGSDFGAVKLWSIETGQQIKSLEGLLFPVLTISFSPDGKTLAAGGNDRIIKLWDVRSGQQIKSLEGSSGSILSIAFSPDGKTLVSGIDSVGSGQSQIKLWSVESGQPLKTFNVDLLFREAVSVSFSPDGKIVAYSGNFDDDVKLLNIENGQQIKSLDGHSGAVMSVAFSLDGKILASGSYDKTVKLWDIETGRQIKSFEGDSGILSVAFSKDNKTIISSSFTTIKLWDVTTGRQVKSFTGHPQLVKSIAFSPKNNLFVSGSTDTTMKIWDKKKYEELATLISLDNNDWIITTPDGRFDTNKLENPQGLHWIMPDNSFDPLSFEVFMRDYYEPNLLPRLLKCTEENNCNQEFKPVRNLTELNRTQPKVRIAEIRPTTSADVVQVAVEAEDVVSEFQKDKQGNFLRSGVEDLRLFRDGQLVGYAPDGEGAVGVDKQGKFTKTFTIKLPKNRDVNEFNFTAYAFNSGRVKSETASLTYTLPQKLPTASGNAYLVTIGVNANENRRYNLRYAANDARKLQEELSKRLPKSNYKKIVQIPLVSDYDKDGRLTENNATKQKIKAVFGKLAGKTVSNDALTDIPNANLLEKVQPEDLVLIAFSGHGYADREGVFYLVPYDIGKNNSGGFEAIKPKTISSDELSLWIRDIDAGEMMMIVDACHSAAAVQGKDFKPGPMGARGLGQLSYDKGMRILTATQADNVAIELGNLHHGLLTYSLVKNGLELWLADYQPKDNKLFSSEWLSFAVKDVPLLYEKAAEEGLKNLFVGGKLRSDVINLEGQKSNLNLQRPSLFDFNRRNRDYDLFSSIGYADESVK